MAGQSSHALVTGGASGIGAAAARRLAADGRTIIVTDLEGRAEDGQAVVDQIRAAGNAAEFRDLDVTDGVAIDTVFDEFRSAGASIDVLVTSAGVDTHPASVDRTPLSHLPIEQFEFVLDVNVYGTFGCARRFAADAIDAGRPGSIITIASLAAKKPKGGVYAVSKSAVWMLTRVLAVELGHYGIRANTVAPGLIDTPLLRHRTALRGGMSEVGETLEDYYRTDIDRLPLRRLGTVDEVASVIGFLASEDSSYVTGSIIGPDGGFATIDGGG